MTQQRVENIEAILREAFQPSHLEVIDESHLHVGHAGAKSGKGHFRVIIQSKSFDGVPRIKQHQQIYDALNNMMETDIHALSIKVI